MYEGLTVHSMVVDHTNKNILHSTSDLYSAIELLFIIKYQLASKHFFRMSSNRINQEQALSVFLYF